MRNISSARSARAPAMDSGIDALVAARLQALRQAQGLSLAQLSDVSGVSKGMISKVERAESSPTATLLGKLAAGLGVPLAHLLTEDPSPGRMLRKREEQETWRDPDSGYRRRQVRERGAGSDVELVEIELPRGAQVSYPRWGGKPYRQCLWLLQGALRLDYGKDSFELAAGDCLDFGVDRPLVFKAMGRTACRYLLVMSP